MNNDYNNGTGGTYNEAQAALFANHDPIGLSRGIVDARWWRAQQCAECNKGLLQRMMSLWEAVNRMRNGVRPYVSSSLVDRVPMYLPATYHQLAYAQCQRLAQCIDVATSETAALRRHLHAHADALQPGEHPKIDHCYEQLLVQLHQMTRALHTINDDIKRLGSPSA